MSVNTVIYAIVSLLLKQYLNLEQYMCRNTTFFAVSRHAVSAIISSRARPRVKYEFAHAPWGQQPKQMQEVEQNRRSGF